MRASSTSAQGTNSIDRRFYDRRGLVAVERRHRGSGWLIRGAAGRADCGQVAGWRDPRLGKHPVGGPQLGASGENFGDRAADFDEMAYLVAELFDILIEPVDESMRVVDRAARADNDCLTQ